MKPRIRPSPQRRAPPIKQSGRITAYTLPPLRRDRRAIDMAERERRALAVLSRIRRLPCPE